MKKNVFKILIPLFGVVVIVVFYLLFNTNTYSNKNVNEKEINTITDAKEPTALVSEADTLDLKKIGVQSQNDSNTQFFKNVKTSNFTTNNEIKKNDVLPKKSNRKKVNQIVVSPTISVQPIQTKKDYKQLLSEKIKNEQGVYIQKEEVKTNVQVNDAVQSNVVQVIIANSVRLTEGKKVMLKVLNTGKIGSIEVTKNSFVYGIIEDAGEKYRMIVKQLITSNGIELVNLYFYDLQGFEGIKKKSKSKELEAAKQTATTIGTSALAITGGMIGAAAGSSLSRMSTNNEDNTTIEAGVKGFLK